MLPNEVTADQTLQEERIKMFLYLVNKSIETKEKIINQEELFATSFNILLSKRKEELQFINESHSKEMQEAANHGHTGDIIEQMVSDNVKKIEIVEKRYENEINDLKIKQKADFTSFLNDLYWLETTKDELDKVDEDFGIPNSNSNSNNTSSLNNNNNNAQSTTTTGVNKTRSNSSSRRDSSIADKPKEPEKVGIIGSLGQGLDKGVQRASSFFSFDRFKKNLPGGNQQQQQTNQQQQQQQGSNTSPITSPTIQSSQIDINNQQQQQQQNQQLNDVGSPQRHSKSMTLGGAMTTTTGGSDVTDIMNSKPSRKDSFGAAVMSTSPKSSMMTQSNASKKSYYKVTESLMIAVGVQKKKLFEFKLIDALPLHLCRPVSTGEYLKSKRIEYIQTLYSDSLSAVILLADPSLSFNSQSEKNFIQYCNMSTELHFDSIDKQIEMFKESVDTTDLKNGDFFITKHSNLSDVQVVFHLLADSKNRTPWGESPFPTTSDLARGLRNIILTASKYGIGCLTIPIALTEADADLNVSGAAIANRTTAILRSCDSNINYNFINISVVRASLTSLHEYTSIKTIQFSLPPSLDGEMQ
ncbi:hypothetical protein PPL_07992 [Heterostelium album PN500]|uniref:Macro domain-containing protein n=1 Tax=Heterostelium pallidum (strain ATCC 26659 / Pp 5 / PN500) TaxID=670386 RepID=D3BHJ0_HETP5|nr:hypothetical protein PPL_07992 [Heterostelium album PN500]EFA79167.1 hypothetical protein PPL_07992 [Heterostelium album PN500]|eukprot:XP_020431288.1 hypothetical protein PPL_07992 [Heterostelium album PN500]